jgi:RNA polymerase sigma-70 factor, ECF subfamily
LEKPDQISRPQPAVAAGQASPRAASEPDGPLTASPDQIKALTRAMAGGSEAAFREFYAAYFDRLLRYLLVVTGGNEESAREALQLTLVRVVRHVKVFEAEETFWCWLTVLARSVLTDESRKRRRYFAFLEKFTRHTGQETADVTDGEADERLRALLNGQLALLPEDERRLMEQKYISRESVRAIAEGAQTSEKAVESKLSRIRKKLKDAVLAELNHETKQAKP